MSAYRAALAHTRSVVVITLATMVLEISAGWWSNSMALLADAVTRYLDAQIRAGAQAVQVFDTWGGTLGPAMYREFSLPYKGPGSSGLGKPLKSILHGNPDIPIMLGTATPLNIRMTAEVADGWLSMNFMPGDMPRHRKVLEEVSAEAFRRIGLAVKIVSQPSERSLQEANQGTVDGEGLRVEGLEAQFPQLVRVPESFVGISFVAFTRDPSVRLNAGWADLAQHRVAFVHGWKMFEANAIGAKVVQRVDKAEQLFQFLEAVKIENLTSPAMTGEWEFHLREMEHGKFSREKFMAEIVRETKGIVERVKGFEEDDSVARTTDIISPTDGKPLKETLRGYKSQDGELMVYKIVGGRRMEEAEVKQLVETKQVGPLDGFISNKTRNRFSAVLKLEVVEETKKDKATKQDVTTRKWKTAFDFGDKVDIATLTPFWTDPKTGAEICESGSSYIVREKKSDGTWEQTFRVGRIMCQKPIPPEQAIKLIGEGKTDLIENFISKKGRPFSAFLKRDGGKFSWEFPPRAPKLDKDGNPIVRKPKAKADLSKAKLLGESRAHAGGQLVELGDAYYVRKPDQDNRQVFKLSKKLCEIDITPEQVQKLLTDGRSDLIEGFVSKRGNKFSAYLVMSQKQDKAEFEFPPR